MRAKRTGALDPYEVLGLRKDASPEDVKAAYRKRAKASHPDAGGDAKEFVAVKAAHVVLSDPVKRKRFDDTGEIDDDGPDNADQPALQVIAQLLQVIIAGDVDPLMHDAVEAMRRTINAKIGEIRNKIVSLDRAAARVETLRGRFRRKGKGPNTIERMLDWQAEAIGGARKAADVDITNHERALEILADYTFARNFEAMIPSFFGASANASTTASQNRFDIWRFGNF
jgi:hypothetical protein